MIQLEWTEEQVLKQAQSNAMAFLLGTTAYFKHCGMPIEDEMKFMAEKFAQGWSELKGKGALDITRQIMLNMVSLGGELISLKGDEKRATAVYDLPIEKLLHEWGLSIEDFEGWHIIHKTTAAYLNINFTWRREGDHRWTYEISY